RTAGELQEHLDHGQGFHLQPELLEAMELGNMLDLAAPIVHGALARQESRGAHFRGDFESRDDENWLAHSLIYREDNDSLRLEKKPVKLGRFEPQERKY